jgi:hypothetical protein
MKNNKHILDVTLLYTYFLRHREKCGLTYLTISLERKEETISAILDFILSMFCCILILARFSFLLRTLIISIRSKSFEQPPFIFQALYTINSELCSTIIFHNILHSTDHHQSAAAILLIPSVPHCLLPFLTVGIRLHICAHFLIHCVSSPSSALTLVFVQTLSLR